MYWSHEQESIFTAFDTESRNILVNAAPGSGKTTVSLELWRRARDQRTMYLAFNKNIVQEMLSKLGTNPEQLAQQGKAIRTFNSLGASICYSAWGKTILNRDKVYKHIDATVGHLLTRRGEKDFEKRSTLAKLVGYLKNERLYSADRLLGSDCVGSIPTEYAVQDLIELYDIDSYPDIERHALRALESSNSDTKVLDFADQLLFPVLYDLQFPYVDVLLGDEQQDVNAIQRDMLLALQKRNPSIRYCLVGDSHQAIYGFRGALADSMSTLHDTFQCVDYPLTITHRCARAIVEEAQRIWPDDITAASDAPEGLVRESYAWRAVHAQASLKARERDYSCVVASDEGHGYSGELFSEGDMLLCRTVAPLVNFAYMLLRNGIPCQIRGRDIAEGLVKYLQKSDCIYVNDFLDYLDRDIGESIERAYAKHQSSRVQSLQDKQEILELFCEQSKALYVSDVIVHIERLFSEGKGIVLSSVHKAKGLEARKVYILAPDLMPHPLAKQRWETVQEKNIAYVAITRAKEELIYI